MANRSYLICTSSSYSFASLNEDEVVCAASYMVPIFWYMLFDEKDLVPASLPCDDDEPDFDYHILSAEKIKAVALAKARLPRLQKLFGDKINEAFYIWLSHVEGFAGNTLILEACEIAMMSDPGDYKDETEQHISAFATDPISSSGFFKMKKSLDERWEYMLEQADISDIATIPEAFKLCGSSWVKSVPWE